MEISERASRLAAQSGDSELVARAFKLSEEAHRGQLRASGEPFVSHPLAVAEILAEEGLAAPTLAAALLHDCVEDASISLEELSEAVGDEVAGLVDGVTKIQRAAPRGSKARAQRDTYRKLIVAATEDARVLVLKLADRLHNMRTISALPVARQQDIAKETLEVYAPLAMRLGMSKFREELEDLSFRLLEPVAWREADLLRAEQGRRRARDLDIVKHRMAGEFDMRQVSASIETRVKSPYSVAQKMARVDGEIYDILGLRIVVQNIDQCYMALGLIHGFYVPRFDRLRDYIARPKSNGYQSLHTTVVGPGGLPIEVQIRTEQMDQAADHGLAAHWLYKEQLRDGGPPATRRWINQLAEHTNLDSDLMLETIRMEIFRDEMWVFTPKGQIHLLPTGSTAVDFAYAVHTSLGHSCTGAKINGQISSLECQLKPGDMVEIIGGGQGPRQQWLQSVASSRAGSRIRAYFAAQQEPQLAQLGQHKLALELAAAGLEPMASPRRLRSILKELGDPDRALAEAANPERAHQIAERLVKKIAGHSPKDTSLWSKASDMGVTVSGYSDLWIRAASCCRPLQGNAIKARVCHGGGVVLHASDCRQLQSRPSAEKIRVLTAHWAQSSSQPQLSAKIELVCRDRSSLMPDLLAAVGQSGLELQDVVLHSRRSLVRGSVVVVLVHAAQRQILVEALEAVEGVLSVQCGPEAQ